MKLIFHTAIKHGVILFLLFTRIKLSTHLIIDSIYLGTATTKSVDLQAGVTCVNCYAYLGSSLLVVVRYGYDSNTFDFEIKAGGDVGFRVDIEVQDPSISLSKTVTILNAESTYTTVSLGQGLYLGHKFGGLTATLTGSGSAIGHASFSTKQSLKSNVVLNYLPSSVTTSFTKSGNYSSPIYTSGSFSSNNFNVGVSLRGTEDFYLTFGGVLTFNFGTNVVGSISSLTETVTNAITSISSSTNPDTVRSMKNPTQYIAATTKSTSMTVGFDIGLSSDSLVVKGAQVAMIAYAPSFPIIPYTTITINTSPTSSPSGTPTSSPSGTPTSSPSAMPTFTPSTAVPTELPTAVPTGPTMTPTSSPSRPTMAPTTSEPTYTPTAVPSEVPTAIPSAIPTGTPTSMPSVIPTESPTESPTSRRPTVRPTPIPGDPTSSPTVKIVKSIRVDQKIGVTNSTGEVKCCESLSQYIAVCLSNPNTFFNHFLLNVSVAHSKIFKKAVKGSVAKLISVEESAINITKILFQEIRRTRTLLASSATVQYDILLINSNMSVRGMQTTLNDAITSGKMTSNIQSYSSTLSGVTAGDAVTSVQDISPTSNPTSSPTESVSRKRLSTSQVVGIAIGVGTGVLFAAGVVCYYCFTGVGRQSQSFERAEGSA